MAYIIDVDNVEMDICDEPDSTVEIIDLEAEVIQEPSPLQIINNQLVERQNMCSDMVASSIRERNRIRGDLEKAQQRRESIASEFLNVCEISQRAARSLADLKASLEEATKKRISLQKEIEKERMWRPPSAEMCLKKQQDLKERVEHMRTILGTGQIRTPDE